MMKFNLKVESEVSEKINDYVLSNQINSQHPLDVISESEADPDRYPVAIYDEEERLIGFLCVHVGGWPEVFGYLSEKYAYIRSMSIDDRYQGKGHGTQTVKQLLDFTKEKIDPDITTLVLAVNEKNLSAQKAYLNAGFERKPGTVPGRRGNLILMGLGKQ